jgi:hypothetical protein
VPLNGKIVITGSGFGAGSSASAWLAAGGDIFLATLIADPDGVITAELTLPSSAVVGDATVSVIGTDPGGNAYALRGALTLTADRGLGALPLIIGALIALLVLGAVAGRIIVRRRETEKPPALPWEQ